MPNTTMWINDKMGVLYTVFGKQCSYPDGNYYIYEKYSGNVYYHNGKHCHNTKIASEINRSLPIGEYYSLESVLTCINDGIYSIHNTSNTYMPKDKVVCDTTIDDVKKSAKTDRAYTHKHLIKRYGRDIYTCIQQGTSVLEYLELHPNISMQQLQAQLKKEHSHITNGVVYYD